MQSITLISTIHKELRNCNSDELLKILESICPDVIFLEALEENYSKYDQMGMFIKVCQFLFCQSFFK